jgi:tripartite-type tricarboxylate transporter receptor subunit TctC
MVHHPKNIGTANMLNCIRQLAPILTIATSFCSPCTLLAQNRYPDRPIRIVIPFAPSGNTDLLGRRFTNRLSQHINQSVIIINKAGAGGTIGSTEVAKAKPDGYTLLIGTSSTHALNPLMTDNMPYDPIKDFIPISVLGISHMVIASHPSISSTLPELIKRIKAQPGKYSYGSSGIGTNIHLTGELFIRQTGHIKLTHVPYKGGGQAVQDAIGGQIPIVMTAISTVMPYYQSRKLRVLAVFSEQRSSAMPEIPTGIESGVPNMLSSSLNVLFSPNNTPKTITDYLHINSQKVIADTLFLQDLSLLGMDAIPDTQSNKITQMISDEIQKWAPLVNQLGLRTGANP